MLAVLSYELKAQQNIDITVHKVEAWQYGGQAAVEHYQELRDHYAAEERAQRAADIAEKAAQRAEESDNKKDELVRLKISEEIADIDLKKKKEFEALYNHLHGQIPDERIIAALAPLHDPSKYSTDYYGISDREKMLYVFNKVENKDSFGNSLNTEPSLESIKLKNAAIRALTDLASELTTKPLEGISSSTSAYNYNSDLILNAVCVKSFEVGGVTFSLGDKIRVIPQGGVHMVQRGGQLYPVSESCIEPIN